jgi:hypothetical protein
MKNVEIQLREEIKKSKIEEEWLINLNINGDGVLEVIENFLILHNCKLQCILDEVVIFNEGKTGNKKTCHSDIECSFINRYDKCKACMKYY